MEPALLEKQSYTPDDLLALTDGSRYDLVDGSLVERHMGSISSWVGGELHSLLRDYCRTHQFGWAWHADAGFNCFPRSGTVRHPDASVIRFGRIPGEQLPPGHIKTVPDLVAEIVSPKDRVDELEAKLLDYRAAGVPLVWVVYPTHRFARVHRADRTVTELGEDEMLSGETVLPGFEVRLRDLFPSPPAPTPA